MNYLISTVLIGLGATAMVDLWSLARRRLLGVPLPDFSLVGRWLAYLPRGTFTHRGIGKSPPVRYESAIGWISHYGIGVGFAAALVAVRGPEWLRAPSLLPALIVGLGSVAAPFLVMQPGMGLGVAARRAARPNAARLQSLVTHAVFGIGLFVSARIVDASF